MGMNKGLWLPPELRSELISALPFHLRWATIRVSRSFDHFLLARQLDWLVKGVRQEGKMIIARYALSDALKKMPDEKIGLKKRIANHIFGAVSAHLLGKRENFEWSDLADQTANMERFIDELAKMMGKAERDEDKEKLLCFLAVLDEMISDRIELEIRVSELEARVSELEARLSEREAMGFVRRVLSWLW